MYMDDALLRDLFYNVFRNSTGVKKEVKHQRTCPNCKRTLVNLYKRGKDIWVCKKCWDKYDKLQKLRGLDGLSAKTTVVDEMATHPWNGDKK